jgi:hypothetical protein
MRTLKSSIANVLRAQLIVFAHDFTKQAALAHEVTVVRYMPVHRIYAHADGVSIA